MAVSTQRVDAVFQLAGSFMSEELWHEEYGCKQGSLSQRPSPLGGHLIRLQYRQVYIEGCSNADFFVRPEVRGITEEEQTTQSRARLVEMLAPGDAIVEQTHCACALRLGGVLFGRGAGPFVNTFFYNTRPTLARHQLRYDWPEPGDCAYGCFQDHGASQEFIMVCRKEQQAQHFRAVLVFHLAEEKPMWARWTSPFFEQITKLGRQGVEHYFNRPHLEKVREVNRRFWIVLCIRNFQRGAPMIPGDEGVMITKGAQCGFPTWRSFCDDKFNLSEYLPAFLAKTLGRKVKAFGSLDGRPLVGFQCAMLRSQWEDVRDEFWEVFRLQRIAYRRAHGGTSAPRVLEDAEPRLMAPRAEPCPMPGLVVRKTFLEAVEPIRCSLPRSASDSDLGGAGAPSA